MIVIIGLIVSGVIAGQKLIKQAKLKSVIQEIQGTRTAFMTFRLKYDALPGDMTNATSYWAGTSNGNGNRQVHWTSSDAANESLRAWQHLSLSGIIKESYTGVGSGGGAGATTPGLNIKASNLGARNGKITGYFFHPHAAPKTDMCLMGTAVGAGVLGQDSVVTPGEAYQMDVKIDDGTASTKGMLWADGGQGSGGSPWDVTCVSGDNYLFTDPNNIHCRLHYVVMP